MPGARIFLIFCYGVFSLAAQVLLFREYMASLDGRDIGIGLFFGAWLLWMAVGTWVFRQARRLASQLARVTELLFLAYIPAFLFQYGLIVFLREAAGAESHVIATLGHILGCSLLATAPVCLLTGLLFPIFACWSTERGGPSITRVYALEAAGSAVGGLGVTALLYLGATSLSILAILSVLISGAACWSSWNGSHRRPSVLLRLLTTTGLVGAIGAMIFCADATLTKIVHQRQWAQLAPRGTLEGGFSTAQADYLYGTDGETWFVARNGRVYETIGDRTPAGRVAAMALAQNTRAEHVLVIGDGWSVCQSFLISPNIKTVDWFALDAEYAEFMRQRLRMMAEQPDERLHFLTGDIRKTLARQAEKYDIVLVNLPGAFTAAAHSFTTIEFFEQVNRSLRTLGLFVLGVSGADSANGAEPAFLGACIKNTLDAVFAQTILAPASNRTYFLSAPAPYLQVSPITLETRLSLLENADEILPPEELSNVYRPGRAMEILDSYDAAALPQKLVNSDEAPVAYLSQLLQTTHNAGLPLSKPAMSLLRGGPLIVIVSVLVLAFVRLAYLITTMPRRRLGFDPSNSDALHSALLIVIGGAGLVSGTAFVILIYAFQMHYGSLHLHMGLFSGLFMLSVAVGATFVRAIVKSPARPSAQPVYFVLCLLVTLMGLHAAALAGAGLAIGRSSVSWPVPAVWMGLSGLFCGSVLAGGSRILDLCGLGGESGAARLAGADHLGIAVGSGLAAPLLIGLLGLATALYIMGLIVLANLLSVGGMTRIVARPGKHAVPHRVLTPAGYSLFALAACVIVGAHLLSLQERSETRSQATTVIQEWVEGRRVTAKTTALAADSIQLPYHEVRDEAQLVGYIFRSEHFTGTVYGYAGPMSVVAFTDPNGSLIDFRITRSRETPRYIRRIRDWMDSLKGKTVFGENPIANVNTVSGATLSSDAILRLLRGSGQQFATSVFGRHDSPQVTTQSWTERINWPLVGWGVGALMAFGAIFHGKLWSRLIVLAFTAAVGGFWLNKQFSTDHVVRLLRGEGLPAGPVAGLCLLMGVPLLIFLFGNLYCGYLCPFGALQELLSHIVPKRLKVRLPLATITLGRSLKYGVLFVLVVAVFVGGSRRFLEVDPLTSVFDRQSWSRDVLASLGLIVAILMLVGTLFVTRLWCRYLCPTGAFLSLFNRAGWLGRLLPAKKFGRCEFGLGGRDHFDCIHCDRCRYATSHVPARNEVVVRTRPKAGSALFLAILFGVALLTLSPLLRRATPAGAPANTTQINAAPDVQDRPETPVQRQRRRRGR